ncbi:hypothetical protein PMZ80_009569 [Knufia obscura]|uniref:SCP domain-containing protein n=1 Tax=Knufia obscura TaxID=1635080 RepID=A0ABR0RBI6_9EURO|nr:hypothetical protein PMZ80_009569 [Knufia obscura]
MKSVLFAASLLGSFVAASLLMEEKRYLVTSVIMETATVTVTAGRGWRPWDNSSPTDSNTVSLIEPTPTPSPSSTAEVTTTIIPSSPSSSPPPAEPTTAPPAETGTGSVSTYADPILKQHNIHRANHTVDALSWDENLASIAAEIASSCSYAHNTQAGGGGYGQNIGAGAPDEDIDKMITNQMYNDEMVLYPGYGGEPDMGNFERWGHFSQIVWKATTKVGCHTQYCPGGLAGVGSNVSPYFTVCNYQPVGNFGGQYADNVLQPKGDAMVTV